MARDDKKGEKKGSGVEFSPAVPGKVEEVVGRRRWS